MATGENCKVKTLPDCNDETASMTSKRILLLRNRKKSEKTRLTKARNHVYDLLKGKGQDETLSSKTVIRRAVNKVKSELSIIEKIITTLKETTAVEDDETVNVDTTIDSLDKELEETTAQVDEIKAEVYAFSEV